MATLGDSTDKLGIQALLELLEALQQQGAQQQASTAKLVAELSDTLGAGMATLLKQRADEKDLQHLVVDTRDTITEAVGIMHSQMSDVLMRLEGVEQRLGATTQPMQRRLPPWRWWASGALVGLALLGGVWWLWPTSRYEAFAGALDAALTQHYATLPKPVQDSLGAIYGQFHFQTPKDRAKGPR